MLLVETLLDPWLTVTNCVQCPSIIQNSVIWLLELIYPIYVHVQFRNIKSSFHSKKRKQVLLSVEALQSNHSTREGPRDDSTNGSKIGSSTTGDIKETKIQLFVSTMASIANYTWWFIYTAISLSYLVMVWFCCSQINEEPLYQQNSWYLDEAGPVRLIITMHNYVIDLESFHIP